MSSARQINANRGNSRLSTGPVSAAGKAKVTHNAVKTGLTGRTVLLPADDAAAYHAHIDRIFKLWAPQSDEENRLTRSLADALWRLERIPALEAGIFALGRRELSALFADEEDDAVRKALIEAQIFLAYRRDLNNLSIQESRLRRQYEKDEAVLKRLLAERKQAETELRKEEERRWGTAIANYQTAKQHDMPFDPSEIGFEFSSDEIARREEQRELEACILNARYYEYKAKGYIKPPKNAA